MEGKANGKGQKCLYFPFYFTPFHRCANDLGVAPFIETEKERETIARLLFFFWFVLFFLLFFVFSLNLVIYQNALIGAEFPAYGTSSF